MSQSKQLLLGFNLYTDRLDHLFYLNRFDHQYYAIDNKSIKKYTIYSFRFPISLAIFYFADVFTHSLLIGALIGIGLYVVLTVAFYMVFLKSLASYPSIKQPNKLTYTRQCKSGLSKIRLQALIGLSAVLAIALVVNVLVSDYSTEINILNYVLAAIVAVFCIIHIVFLSKGNYIQ